MIGKCKSWKAILEVSVPVLYLVRYGPRIVSLCSWEMAI